MEGATEPTNGGVVTLVQSKDGLWGLYELHCRLLFPWDAKDSLNAQDSMRRALRMM